MRLLASSKLQRQSARPLQLVRRPSLRGLVAAWSTPLPCLRASFQHCLPCRTWRGFFRCSPLARICISVPHETPVPCVTMACLNLHNASPPRRCSPPKVWSSRCSSSSAGARAAMPIITYRTQQAVCAYSEASRCRTRAAPTRATFTSPQAACGRRRSWSTLRRRHSTRTRGSQPSWPSTA